MYNYFDEVKSDVLDAIKDNYGMELLTKIFASGQKLKFREDLYDEFLLDDHVTGNGSGYYTLNAYEAEENLAHNWQEIEKVAAEFGYEPIIKDGYEYGPEWWDVKIRCFYLYQAVSEVLDELEEDFEDEREEGKSK